MFVATTQNTSEIQNSLLKSFPRRGWEDNIKINLREEG
jgi:hypothetical protein